MVNTKDFTFLMPSVMLDVLRRGFNALKKHIGPHSKTLNDCLVNNESITSDDKRWLDNEGNIADEEWVPSETLKLHPTTRRPSESIHGNGKNQTKTAKHFDPIYPNLHLKQTLVSSWHPEAEQMMELWVAQAMSHGIQLSGEVLHQNWTAFADLVGVDADEWLALRLKEFKRHGEAVSTDPAAIEAEQAQVQIATWGDLTPYPSKHRHHEHGPQMGEHVSSHSEELDKASVGLMASELKEGRVGDKAVTVWSYNEVEATG
ncbi:hypothetical protein DFH08DRAFT_820348 [Mycena albidolilacea]|uniref:Uncharacterized protein n=1 Tax=Mycena albidolilacea TaxID=1033008 RepID=A0AAD7EEC3_9AGAR|nr:hypothetical protein DFH08DRAFT_820348 [Mycena albidolilacea]